MPIANPGIVAEPIKSALTTTEYAVRGARSYLFVLQSGSCRLIGDDDEQSVDTPCLIWTPTGKIAKLSLSAGSRGFMLRIPETLLGRSIPAGSIAGYVRYAIANLIVSSGLPPERIERLKRSFEEIEAELFDNSPGAAAIVQHCISLILVQVWRTSNPVVPKQDLLPRRIVHDFLHLVELHMYHHWTVSQYAKQIGVSKDRLNTSVRRAINTTPHQHIQTRLFEETKTLLLNSDLQVAEIAYRLGFSDAAYFNRFFQRHAGVSPGRYRTTNSAADPRTEQEESFAAWP